MYVALRGLAVTRLLSLTLQRNLIPGAKGGWQAQAESSWQAQAESSFWAPRRRRRPKTPRSVLALLERRVVHRGQRHTASLFDRDSESWELALARVHRCNRAAEGHLRPPGRRATLSQLTTHIPVILFQDPDL